MHPRDTWVVEWGGGSMAVRGTVRQLGFWIEWLMMVWGLLQNS